MIRNAVPLILYLYLYLFLSPLTAQSKGSAQIESTSSDFEIALCSDVDECINVPIVQSKGQTWLKNGNHAALTVQHIDATSVTIHREDLDGPSTGLLGDYVGTRTGNWIEGKVVFNWPGHSKDPLNGTWRALVVPTVAVAKDDKEYLQSLSKATAWLVCMDPGDETCPNSQGLKGLRAVWVLDGARGHSRFLVSNVTTNPIFVDHFDEHTIELRTMDLWGDFTALTGQYMGTRQGDAMEGTLKYLWPGHPEAPHTGKWYATRLPLSCKGESNVNITYAKLLNQAASMVSDAPGAAQCILIAAKLGDAGAEETAGEYYQAGSGLAKDMTQAIFWYKKSADQENVSALIRLATVYEKGDGVPKDLLSSNYYKNSALLLYRAQNPPANRGVGSGIGYLLGTLWSGAIPEQLAADETLKMTIAHQRSVLDEMKDGSSRVEAERRRFNAEEARASGAKTDQCRLEEPHQGASETSAQWRARDDHDKYQYESCLTLAQDVVIDAHNRRAEYMQCVVNNVDSNIIETKCKYLP